MLRPTSGTDTSTSAVLSTMSTSEARRWSTFVLVHGLGGSHLNWELFAPLLTPAGRVLALVLPGFGLSEPGERPATVPANVLVLDSFLRQVAGRPVLLVGNSMGGMISILLAARSPESVTGLVLLDPALPPPLTRVRNTAAGAMFLGYALPGVGERLMRARRARLGPRALVHATLRLCGIDPATVPPDLIARSVAFIERRSDVAGMCRRGPRVEQRARCTAAGFDLGRTPLMSCSANIPRRPRPASPGVARQARLPARIRRRSSRVGPRGEGAGPDASSAPAPSHRGPGAGRGQGALAAAVSRSTMRANGARDPTPHSSVDRHRRQGPPPLHTPLFGGLPSRR